MDVFFKVVTPGRRKPPLEFPPQPFNTISVKSWVAWVDKETVVVDPAKVVVQLSKSSEVTYLYISGIVTIPKQSECNVNSYNKDTVAFCKCENAVS